MKVVIVGAGKLGYKLAEALLNGDNYVIVIDQNEQVLERVNEQLDVLTIRANGVQMEALNELDISTCDLVIAVTNADETNMIICMIAKKLGCKNTIARIRNPEYVKQLDFIKMHMNIDHIVNPELATSNEIIRYLLKGYALHTEDFALGKVSLIDFNINHFPNFIGKKIKILKELQNILIVAISRNGEIIIPHGNIELKPNDILYTIGKKENIDKLIKKGQICVGKAYLKNVMILGGGKIGYYLADKLDALGIQVKIIEQNKERCEYLSEKLNNPLVILGDGTDINLLEEEDISSMDAFVSVTGYDEENLLMALLAKQYGVNNIIAKISRASYSHIIERLGIDVALNPINITASDILKFIRGGKVANMALLLKGQAEVTEIIVTENMDVINKPISKLNLPKGIIIGSIVRNETVIIPKGNTQIYPQDRVIVFCLQSEVYALEKFFKLKKGGLFHESQNSDSSIRKSSNA